jgi:hypothetical protein
MSPRELSLLSAPTRELSAPKGANNEPKGALTAPKGAVGGSSPRGAKRTRCTADTTHSDP